MDEHEESDGYIYSNDDNLANYNEDWLEDKEEYSEEEDDL